MAVRRLALVTGASAGIGAAFARAYAARGYDLALTARRLDRLVALAGELATKHGVEVFTIAADLSKPGAADEIVTAIAARGRHVDVLVNNAGYGLPGTWASTSWPDQAAFLAVLLSAPLELSHKLVPGMVERGYGRVLNIASLAGFAPGGYGHTLYGAVKSAMIKFSQSLHVECEGKGVHVTAVCPGLTYSEFHDVNGARESLKGLPRFAWQTAEEVVEASISASEKNRTIIVTGAVNKTLAGLTKVLPDGVSLWLVKRQLAKLRGETR